MANKALLRRLAHAAPLFAALGDLTRLAILQRLAAEGTLSVSQLSADAAITRQAVSKHLAVLAAAGLIHGQRQGREQHYALEAAKLQEAGDYLTAISRQWDDALLRLKHFVED